MFVSNKGWFVMRICVTSPLWFLVKSGFTSSATSYCSFQNKGPRSCPCTAGSFCVRWARLAQPSRWGWISAGPGRVPELGPVLKLTFRWRGELQTLVSARSSALWLVFSDWLCWRERGWCWPPGPARGQQRCLEEGRQPLLGPAPWLWLWLLCLLAGSR